jgi:hypothetical protein
MTKPIRKKEWTQRYEKTKSGFLVRLYRNMRSRIVGIQKTKHHLYEGKCILEKEMFYEWANSSKEFHRLFGIWEISGYKRRLTPSVDRVDSTRGYIDDNMEWVPFYINCSRGGKYKPTDHGIRLTRRVMLK